MKGFRRFEEDFNGHKAPAPAHEDGGTSGATQGYMLGDRGKTGLLNSSPRLGKDRACTGSRLLHLEFILIRKSLQAVLGHKTPRSLRMERTGVMGRSVPAGR